MKVIQRIDIDIESWPHASAIAKGTLDVTGPASLEAATRVEKAIYRAMDNRDPLPLISALADEIERGIDPTNPENDVLSPEDIVTRLREIAS